MSERLEEFRGELKKMFPDEPGDNVMEMLDVGNPERPHTWILEWVLTPDAEHSGGEAFQEALAELLGVDGVVPADIKSFARKVGSDDAEVDVILRGPKACVGIEMKTQASARPSKLQRELDGLRDDYRSVETHELVLLTHDPDDEPTVEDNAYQRITWTELAEALRPRIRDANKEWHGFLNHLFKHFEETIMEPEELRDIAEEAEESTFYAYTVDFINSAKKSYEAVRRQFLKQIADEIEETFSVESESQVDSWSRHVFECRLNYEYELKNKQVTPKNLAVYHEEWPSGAIDEEEVLTVRFAINLRDYNSSVGTVALQQESLSKPLGIGVNFDLFTADGDDFQQQVREDFLESLPADTESKLVDNGYEINISSGEKYHIIGKLLEDDWPPDQELVEEVLQELDLLMKVVHEPATETIEAVEEGEIR